MGFTIPPPPPPTGPEQARILITRKESIEAELEAQLSVLQANSSTLRSPLVDTEGFPRADIDVYAVRGARVRILELRNDLDAVMTALGKALEAVFDPSLSPDPTPAASKPADADSNATESVLQPFAKVNGIAPGSPAAEAGLQREDLVVKFGHLTRSSFQSASALQPLAELVGDSENRRLPIQVIRGAQTLTVTLTPKKWSGRGMLGCHIVPYTSPP